MTFRVKDGIKVNEQLFVDNNFDVSARHITLTGEVRGPSTFTIDPAAVGDNTGVVVIKGDLQVDGTTTTINSTTVNVDDKNVVLASGAINAAAADGSGITVDGASATFNYASSGDKWVANKKIETSSFISTVTTGTAPLTVSSTSVVTNLNADKLDGQDGTYYSGLVDTEITARTAADATLQNNINAEITARTAADATLQSNFSNASNLTSGTISSTILGNSTLYIGTTAVTLNRASGALVLTGITSIDGNAATATTATTANATNTANNFQMNSLGVGTAGSGTAGEIRATNNVTAYYTSDRSLKENDVVIENALAKVSSIRGITFDWKDEEIAARGGEDGYFVRKHDVGVIAQEIEAVLPEAVATRENGIKAVRYDLIVPLLIEAIKELKAEIEILKQ